ncbi:low molecular weight protein-tyrosine-phosphatase [Wolinella succinogenes]|uniref:protein-tyrosine-phosphatase n=1 Tax=Wolinella succinogenes (strain ATCC 29543 / DSM 1740 / CCUG 13145 / JCM 31913 / LMG 7466 / NCTC 11488 / FDC 602W) TaxID=273121 RepID=Q7M8Y0_WOLSU|nr:low molecular weight protein-tyrosine-phosphatase [Wolinella succinogenes]CAE10399.1 PHOSPHOTYROSINE PROTEIN PHOSPHATASE [Wolinella succinogenes]VEG80488.1 Low molecular weight protein-tyrosine-phosphatase yfkJ [Wolinella succinogenes]HCZ19821.1 low molecular weight phosphotyrosine protein phosphatase [Helicobacter sp.]
MSVRSILFVCLGNICRSPLAEGIARNLAEYEGVELELDSAGTGAWHRGELPCEGSVRIAQKRGVDISMLRARQVREEDASRFDLIIAMDQNNLSDLKRFGFPQEKLFLLGEFGLAGQDIPDPYHYRGEEGFEKVFEMIEEGVKTLLKNHGLLRL